MDPWIPPVISGAFSIVVVLIGAWLVNRREERSQQSKWLREDQSEQRRAVAAYLHALKEADREWQATTESLHHPTASPEEESELKRARWKAIEKCYRAFADAAVILDTELTDPKVRQAFKAMNDDIENESLRIRRTLTYNTIESWSEINLHRPLRRSVATDMEYLAKTARKHLHGRDTISGLIDR